MYVTIIVVACRIRFDDSWSGIILEVAEVQIDD